MRCELKWLAILLIPACLTGCFVPFGYPRIEHINSVPLDTDAQEVHAFRVEQNISWVDLGQSVTSEVLTEVPISSKHAIPLQRKASFSYGYLVLGIAVNFPVEYSKSVVIRIYRPGFELVEVKSSDRLNAIDWKKTATIGEEESSMDQLVPQLSSLLQKLPRDGKEKREKLDEFLNVSRTLKSKEHKKALQFIAKEYNRLAGITLDAEQRDRLLWKSTNFDYLSRDH